MLSMKRLTLGAALAAVLATQSACVTMQTKEDVGRVAGAVGGIALGSLFGKGDGRAIMMAIGGIAGYVIGGNVGKSMDREDQERAGGLARRSFDAPRPVEYRDTWQNQRGYRYESQVTTQPVYVDRGRNCKPFTQTTTVSIDGRYEPATQRGIVCFERTNEYPQGTWVIQK